MVTRGGYLRNYLLIFSIALAFYSLATSVIIPDIFARQAFAAFPGANGRIAFATNRDADFNYEVYVMNADGTGQTKLTATSDNIDPSWSPDGTKIAFTSNIDSLYYYNVYVMNADGTGQTRLTNNLADDTQPDWQRIVTTADFSLSCSPNSLTTNQGSTNASSTCTIGSLNGFSSPVSLQKTRVHSAQIQ